MSFGKMILREPLIVGVVLVLLLNPYLAIPPAVLVSLLTLLLLLPRILIMILDLLILLVLLRSVKQWITKKLLPMLPLIN